MNPVRSHRLALEGLESRRLLSGTGVKGAALPYSVLALKGDFLPGVPTSVTFAGKGGEAVSVIPGSVTGTTIRVTVPAFFNPKTGRSEATTAKVSVEQVIGGATTDVQVIKRLSIAALRRTGLAAGDVIGGVTVAAAAVTSVTAANFSRIGAGLTTASPRAATGVARAVADLNLIGQIIPLAQQQLVALARGTAGEVPLGTYNGQPASLDATQLGGLDRIIAGGIDGASRTARQGPALIQSLNSLVVSSIQAGPTAVIDRAVNVVDVMSTALGPPVVPPGAVVTGLAIGALSAVVVAAEAESQILLAAPAPFTSANPAALAMIERVLDDPALGLALNAIVNGLVPNSPAGLALIQAARLAEDLAAQIDPNIPGSLGTL